MLSNCGAAEDSWESLGLQGDQTNPKGNQPWIFIRRTDAEPSILCHLMWRADSLVKTLMLGKTEGKRTRGWQRVRYIDSLTQWTWICYEHVILSMNILSMSFCQWHFVMSIDSMDMNLREIWEIVKDREAWHAAVHGVTNISTWLSKWTTTTSLSAHFYSMGFSGTL